MRMCEKQAESSSLLNTEMCVDYVFKALMIHNICTYISQEDHKMCKFMENDVLRCLSWTNTYSTSMTQMNLRRSPKEQAWSWLL